MTTEQAALNTGDEIVILKQDRTHVYGEWSGSSSLPTGTYGVAKFVTKSSGTIGADEVQIESKQKTQAQLQAKIDRIPPDMADIKADVIMEYRSEIQTLDSEINQIYSGTTGVTGLYEKMYNLMNPNGLLSELDNQNTVINTLNMEQDEIEATFIVAMGYLLRDGYWSNNNYIVGQEEFLYRDAVDMAKEMSKPATSYSVTYVRTPEGHDIPMEEIEMNAIFKIYDEELNIDDKMFVKKRTFGVDNKKLGSIEVSNQDITLTGNDLGSVLSRMSQLSDLPGRAVIAFPSDDFIVSPHTLLTSAFVLMLIKGIMNPSIFRQYCTRVVRYSFCFFQYSILNSRCQQPIFYFSCFRINAFIRTVDHIIIIIH